MNKSFAAFAIFLLTFLSACASRKATSAPSNLSAGGPEAKVAAATPGEEISGPEVATTLPDNASPSAANANDAPPASSTVPASVIVLGDNGKTFTFHVGDSFLLNLGAGYEWTVEVDNQEVVALQVGVTVTEGAQGMFEALKPGTATLTAVGDPLCRKVTPPCMMPTILFQVTLVVE